MSANVPAPATKVIEPSARGQPLDADADVALERERRVLEPALEHALVAGADELGVAAVGDEREPGAAEREVALMRLHGGDDHALGQLEEPLVELAVEHVRPLDQVHDLLEHAAGSLHPPIASRPSR